jgi:3-oxoacyl-[acyl-carrier protein] reductase
MSASAAAADGRTESVKTDRHVALVTGGSRNIGREIVLALARRGVDVIVNARSGEAEAKAVVDEATKLGVRARSALGDIGEPDDVRRLAAEALETFGTVDIVVNNAAIRPESSLLSMADEEWERVIAVDLSSAFYTAKAFVPGMVAAKWGRIVNITGMNAIFGHAGRAHVSAAKHGLWGLTKALARELGPHGITVNAISPGPIDTERRDAAMAQRIQAQLADIPVGRLGRSEEIAALCAFLASDEAAFISGQMIAVNGAMTT